MTRPRVLPALVLGVVLALIGAGTAAAAELVVDPAADVRPGTAIAVQGKGFLPPPVPQDCELRYTGVETRGTTRVACDPVGENGGAGGFAVKTPGEYVVEGCVPTCDHPRAGRVRGVLVVERIEQPPVVDAPLAPEPVPTVPLLNAPRLESARALPLAAAPRSEISVRPDRVEEGGRVIVEFVAPPQEVPATCDLLWAGAVVGSAGCSVDADGVLVGRLVVPDVETGSYPVRACRPDCREPVGGAGEAVVAVLVPPEPPVTTSERQPRPEPQPRGEPEPRAEPEPRPEPVTPSTAAPPLVTTDATTSAEVPPPMRTPSAPDIVDPPPAVAEPPVVVPRLTAVAPGRVEDVLGPGLRLGSVSGEGRVLEQDPPPGAVVPHGTEVDVVLAPDVPVPQVAVPPVEGLSVEAARAALAPLGLGLSGAPPPDGRIETQDPAAGALVDPGSLVAVELVAETVPVAAAPSWGWPVALLVGAALLVAGAGASAGRSWWRGRHPLPRPALRVYPDQAPSLRVQEEVPDRPGLRLLVRGYPDVDPTVVTEVTP